MKIKIQRLSINELIFFSAYCIYLVISLLNTSFYSKFFMGKIYTLIKLICIFLLLLNEIIKTKMNLKSLEGLMVAGFIYVIVAYNTSFVSDIVMLLIFVYCARDISFEKIARFTVYISSTILMFIILSAHTGIIMNYVEIADNRRREYLGFRYSLYPSAIMFNITALVLYLKRRHIGIKEILLLSVMNLFVFYKTNSRLSFYMAILMICCMVLFQKFPKVLENSKIVHIGMSISFVLTSICSVWVMFRYDAGIEWMRLINEVFNNRLKFGNRSLILYGISMFGKKNMEWIGNGLDSAGNKSAKTYLWVDNFYISILQRFGIFLTVMIILLLTITMIKCLKIKRYYLMFILTLMAGHCMIDDLVLYLHYNTFWFAIGAILMMKRVRYKDKLHVKYPIIIRKRKYMHNTW